MPHLHPGAPVGRVEGGPAHLNVAKHTLRVRHHGRKTTIRSGHGGQATRAAIGVIRVGFGGSTVVVDEPQGGNGIHATVMEVGVTFAVRMLEEPHEQVLMVVLVQVLLVLD